MVEKQSNKKVVECLIKTPHHGKIDKGKSVKFYSSSIESPKKSIMKCETLQNQCVSHMCYDMNNIVKNKSKHEAINQFVDVNPYEILADIDFSIVNTCQPVNVNNVVRASDGETCHEASVLLKNDRYLTKGKTNQFTVSKKGYPSTGEPKGSNCSSKIGVSRGISTEAPSGCQVENGVVDTVTSNTAVVDLHDNDKYELEIQTKLKKSKIQVAKGAPENELCIQQNRPLFGFIPIYGLKSRVYDSQGNSVCKDILEFHKQLKQDGRHNYVGLQVPVISNLKYEKWAQYLTYWDWQLPLLIKYGFPLDFDRNSDIICDKINHKSAIEYPEHVTAYLQEELNHKAMLGPFRTPPINNLHVSHFMTWDKSSSVNRRS